MGGLGRYLVTSVGLALLPVVFLLLALFGFLSLAEELEDVGEGSFEALDAITVVGLSLPNLVLDLLPVALLLGALVGLGGLANNSELIAARAAGRSPMQLLIPPMIFGLVLALLFLLMGEFLVPAAEQQAGQLRAKALADFSVEENHIWTRTDEQIVKIGTLDRDGMLQDVEIFAYDAGRLSSVRQAKSAEVLDADHWRLEDVSVLVQRNQGATQTQLPVELWPISLPQDKLAVLAIPPESLSMWDLRARILRALDNELDVHGLRVMMWQRLSLPLAAIAMILLSLPFVLGSTRILSAGERVTYGVLAGLTFYLTEQFCAHIAIIAKLNPVVMAIAPEVVVITLVGWWLYRSQVSA